jgi:antirestriction protein ArdC
MDTQSSPSEIASQALVTLTEALKSGKSETLTAYLKVMARFTKYSWNNSLLIAIQRPSATRVAGFRAWLGFGRHVRKGEKGIAILAPVICKRKCTDAQGDTTDESSDTTTAERRLVAFRIAHVFDLAQTDGQDLPEFATVQGEPRQHLMSLKNFVATQDIALEYDIAIAPARGISQGGTIKLLPDTAPAEEFSTLVHELAHEMLHKSDRRAQTTKTIRETEAEAVAFVVCQAIGLDTNTAAADYIALYNGDAATLSASLQLIQTTACVILTALQSDETAQ